MRDSSGNKGRYRRSRGRYARNDFGLMMPRARVVRKEPDESRSALIALAMLGLLVLSGISAIAIGIFTGQEQALYGGVTILGLMVIVYLLLRD